jgi:hypothetical protein
MPKFHTCDGIFPDRAKRTDPTSRLSTLDLAPPHLHVLRGILKSSTFSRCWKMSYVYRVLKQAWDLRDHYLMQIAFGIPATVSAFFVGIAYSMGINHTPLIPVAYLVLLVGFYFSILVFFVGGLIRQITIVKKFYPNIVYVLVVFLAAIIGLFLGTEEIDEELVAALALPALLLVLPSSLLLFKSKRDEPHRSALTIPAIVISSIIASFILGNNWIEYLEEKTPDFIVTTLEPKQRVEASIFSADSRGLLFYAHMKEEKLWMFQSWNNIGRVYRRPDPLRSIEQSEISARAILSSPKITSFRRSVLSDND